jgi:hypothetical protein
MFHVEHLGNMGGRTCSVEQNTPCFHVLFRCFAESVNNIYPIKSIRLIMSNGFGKGEVERSIRFNSTISFNGLAVLLGGVPLPVCTKPQESRLTGQYHISS